MVNVGPPRDEKVDHLDGAQEGSPGERRMVVIVRLVDGDPNLDPEVLDCRKAYAGSNVLTLHGHV